MQQVKLVISIRVDMKKLPLFSTLIFSIFCSG